MIQGYTGLDLTAVDGEMSPSLLGTSTTTNTTTNECAVSIGMSRRGLVFTSSHTPRFFSGGFNGLAEV